MRKWAVLLLTISTLLGGCIGFPMGGGRGGGGYHHHDWR
jgi:hypothetical protein